MAGFLGYLGFYLRAPSLLVCGRLCESGSISLWLSDLPVFMFYVY